MESKDTEQTVEDAEAVHVERSKWIGDALTSAPHAWQELGLSLWRRGTDDPEHERHEGLKT